MNPLMPEFALRRPLQWLFGSAHRPRPADRQSDLLRLAADVETEDPSLASELRGMAMHEAAAAPAHPVPRASSWRLAAGAVWDTLQAVGHRRAEREIALLLAQWDVTQPEMARDLRSALRRGD
jgi:hypothetical protein